VCSYSRKLLIKVYAMEKLISLVLKSPKTRTNNDDDFADRLSSRYTVVQLVAFSVLVGFTQVGNSILIYLLNVHFIGYNDLLYNMRWLVASL